MSPETTYSLYLSSVDENSVTFVSAVPFLSSVTLSEMFPSVFVIVRVAPAISAPFAASALLTLMVLPSTSVLSISILLLTEVSSDVVLFVLAFSTPTRLPLLSTVKLIVAAFSYEALGADDSLSVYAPAGSLVITRSLSPVVKLRTLPSTVTFVAPPLISAPASEVPSVFSSTRFAPGSFS